jgi:hypothetical protein
MPDAQTVLGLWERCEREHPIDRTLSLLAAFTSQPRSQLAALPVHRRDALLLNSRVAAFGKTLDGVAICQACGCRIEVAFELPDVSGVVFADQGEVVTDRGGVTFRVPDSRDLAAAARTGDSAVGAELLLDRCRLDGPANPAANRAVDEELARLCDATSLELKLTCPECADAFVAPVDIGRFFWKELSVYAERLIDDVHVLAAHYGWAEADILAMSERRRRRYLERLV